jgi:hypothetical protein
LSASKSARQVLQDGGYRGPGILIPDHLLAAPAALPRPAPS